MGRFGEYCKWTMLIEAAETYDILGASNFKGQNHDLKVSVIRFRNDYSPRVVVSSLKDPMLSGFVEYPDKQKAILAYLNLRSTDDVVDYMKRWQTVPSAYKFAMLLKDESGSVKAATQTPEEEVPVAHENMPSEAPSTRGLLAGPEPTPGAPPMETTETPHETGAPSPETTETAPIREIGTSTQPPTPETETAPETERENLFR